MNRLVAYKAKYDALIEEMKALNAKADPDTGKFSAEDQAAYDALEAKQKDLFGSIQREKAAQDAERASPAIVTVEGPAAQRVPAISGGHDRAGDQKFASLGEQLAAIVQAQSPGGFQDPRLFAVDTPSGASANVGTDGGFLIQKDFAAELMSNGFNAGALAAKCSTQEISATSDGLEVVLLNETSRATGSRWGGVQIYRRAEADSVTAKKPALDKWEVRLEDLMGLAYVTDRLMQDAPAMAGVFNEAFVEEFGFKLDDEIFRGSGAGECLGILNAACTVSQAKETGQVADTIVADNVINMFARVLPRSAGKGEWFINVADVPQLQKMFVATGTGGQLVWMPPTGLTTSPYGTLMGRPVNAIEQASALGDVGDISFLDLSQYKLIRKGGVQQDESIHVRFIYTERTLRWIARVNGAPKLKSAITPYKGANTLSTFVTLAAR